jgi:hypothetical protein
MTQVQDYTQMDPLKLWLPFPLANEPTPISLSNDPRANSFSEHKTNPGHVEKTGLSKQ